MIDLTLSPWLANPQAVVEVARALGGRSGVSTGRVEGSPEFASPPPKGFDGWNSTALTKHAVEGRSHLAIVRAQRRSVAASFAV
jgi:hypothetical protein